MATARHRLSAEDRRAVIVEAAGPLFGARGYDATRLDDVAAAAGVTKPILYRHFTDKRALYLALLERHRTDLSSFAAAIPDEGSDEQRLRAVLDTWLDYVEAHSYAWKMLFRDSGGGSEVAAYRTEVHARARVVMAEIIGMFSEGAIPPRQRQPLGELMTMGMANLVLWWIENPEVKRRDVLDSIARVFAGLLVRHN
jgi:AcrR family transcriptional regulator